MTGFELNCEGRIVEEGAGGSSPTRNGGSSWKLKEMISMLDVESAYLLYHFEPDHDYFSICRGSLNLYRDFPTNIQAVAL